MPTLAKSLIPIDTREELEEVYRLKAKENQKLSEGRGKKGLATLANLIPINTREELEEVYRLKAKENQIRKPISVLPTLAKLISINTREELAKKSNASHGTFALFRQSFVYFSHLLRRNPVSPNFYMIPNTNVYKHHLFWQNI